MKHSLFGWKQSEVNFTFYTDAEISPSKQEELAETYSPVLYFHEDEDYKQRNIYGTCSIYRRNCEIIPVDI